MGLRSLGQCAPMRGLLRAGECRAERGRWGRELSEGVAPLVSTGCPSPKCLPSMSVDGSHLSWVTSYQGRLKQWLWAQPWDKRDGGGKAPPPSRILLSRKPRPLQHVLQHWGGGGSLPPGAQCSSQARGIWGSSHSPSWLRSPTSLFLTGSRAGAFSVSRLFYSCRSPGRHQNSHKCPTAALVSAPGLSCSAGGLSSTWPLGPLVTSSLPGPPGVFPFLEGGLLTMTASFLLCCSYERLILQPHPAFLILICSAVPPPRLTSFLMGPPSHSPSHTAFSASISEGQGEHTGIILLRKKRFIFSGNSESQD